MDEVERDRLAKIMFETLRDMDVGLHYCHHSDQGEWSSLYPDAWRSPYLKAAEAVAAALPPPPPAGDADGDGDIDDLVNRFAAALKAKLRRARARGKHGWQNDDWMESCQRQLIEHLTKGDPLDIGAYAAFMWHHGWPTVAPAGDGARVTEGSGYPAKAGAWRAIAEHRGIENDKLRAAILDIDAHATAYGSGEWAEHYVISAGSLHRALGIVGHTAPKCGCGETCAALRAPTPAPAAPADAGRVAEWLDDAEDRLTSALSLLSEMDPPVAIEVEDHVRHAGMLVNNAWKAIRAPAAPGKE